MENVNAVSGEEIDEYTKNLIQSFYKNNSRLITTAIEMEELYKVDSGKVVELKDGVVSLYRGMVNISGNCLGANVQFTHPLYRLTDYIINIQKKHALYGFASEKIFRLYASVEILTEGDDENISVIFDKNTSLNHIHGSKEYFLEWYDKTLEKRFPMSRIDNPLARF